MYMQHHASILKEYKNLVQRANDYKHMVFTTWTVSYEQLDAQASLFLRICAFLHHDGISEAIFQKASTSRKDFVPGSKEESSGHTMAIDFLTFFLSDGGEWNTQKFLDVIGTIGSYSLIEFDERNHQEKLTLLISGYSAN
jgi:hypothetical protein